jgi:hypothetical protein
MMIYPTESSVKKYMKLAQINFIVMYVTAYVNEQNQQEFGYSIQNINSDYYFNQKIISSKTVTFSN